MSEMGDRDFEVKPYSEEERRVADYLGYIAPGIGAGADPIGFLIASHFYLLREQRAKPPR